MNTASGCPAHCALNSNRDIRVLSQQLLQLYLAVAAPASTIPRLRTQNCVAQVNASERARGDGERGRENGEGKGGVE
jgi:hypothetical protein